MWIAAVAAARRAFDSYSRTTPAERRSLLQKILAGYVARNEEMAKAISIEMGAPMKLARESQAPSGTMHLEAMIEVLDTFKFEEQQGRNKLAYEPVGVCALITPWNWPMNQIGAKVVPALAAGLHHGAQAFGVLAIQRDDLDRDPARCRRARRRVQPD